MTQYSISQLARKFGLSRSTLLYYDQIGLLKPAARTRTGYRVYTPTEHEKLRRIDSLRKTGLSLEQISRIIDSEDSRATDILQNRLARINEEIKELRLQQNIIIRLLNNKEMLKNSRVITKEIWVGLLRSAGLDESGMNRWHIEFEHSAPEAHQDFLEFIGLTGKEIEEIRDWSKGSRRNNFTF